MMDGNGSVQSGSPKSGALAGTRVVDLTRALAGPLCTQMLADHGAEVIKIEPPAGDEARWLGPPFAAGSAAYYHGLNRNKRAIALDLGKREAREVLLLLLEGADVLVENFLPGTMEKWGLGYDEALAQRFPRLVYCRISGFGSAGPLGGLPGYDAVLQAFCGLMAAGVPAAPVNSIPQALEHPHTAARGMRVAMGEYQGLGVHVKLSRTPGAARVLPPAFGADTRSVLAKAGYSAREIEGLIASGAVHERPAAGR